MSYKWKDLVNEAGIVRDKKLNGITVRHLPNLDADDVVLCPISETDKRMMVLKESRAPRRMQPERVFMARALKNDAETATALLVRAIIGRWIFSRGKRSPTEGHELKAWTLLNDHLSECGQQTDIDPIAGRHQIPDTYITAPIFHESPADVVKKAIGQLSKQIGTRDIIVFGESPLAV